MTNLTIKTVGGTQSTPDETIQAGQFAIGINLSGLEYNGGPNAKAGYNYAVPTLAELQYYHSQGQDLIRLPIAWETLQTSLNGPLNATYLAQIKGVVSNAASLGMKVILDIHSFGGYNGVKLGTPTVTDADFANMWKQLASNFVGNPGITGYDLMNEPNNMPSATAWTSAAQAAITAIRGVDKATTIYVEGNGYSNAPNWAALNPGLAQLNDPSKNLVFSAHLYLDNDDSGTHFDWAQEAAAGDTTQIGVQRLTPFVAWLNANHLKGEIGELGVGNDNPAWLQALKNTLTYAQSNNLAVTYWAGGPWWGSYPMSVEPTNGVTAPQMAILDKFSGDYATVSSATVSGTAPAGSTVYLSQNLVQLATTTANAQGVWSYTLTGLNQGKHVIVASENPPSMDGVIASTVFDLVTKPAAKVVSNGWVSEVIACFTTGTRIATPEGEVAVEVLRVGDLIKTIEGSAPIKWIGKRMIDITRHPDADTVRPVRIAAYALGEQMPVRDLVLSPDHALFLGGMLIPAKALLNGVTVTQLSPSQVTYYHIELPAHGVLFAEGAPAETYLDTGNRGSFENGGPALTLHPDFAQTMRVAESCARFAEAGPEVETVRAEILALAQLDLTDDPNMCITYSDGHTIINSRSAVPGLLTPDPRDRRVLGVKIGNLSANGGIIPLDHPLLVDGWHDIEPDGRWTNGRAVIPRSLTAGLGIVTPSVVATMQYQVPVKPEHLPHRGGLI